ncbi:MAG: FtsK/SpoIIIE domain-containing protein [Kofleriaceae bacterium]
MTNGRSPTPIGELAALLFLERLHGQGFRTSNRHIVDYLPPDVSAPLFEALLDLTDHQVEIRIPTDGGDDRIEQLQAIRDDHYDVVPFLVDEAPGKNARNRGTEGFASCLRDHYSVDAARPRLLVAITTHGNETQKSAQDALADQALITLDALLEQVLARAQVPKTSPLAEVAKVYAMHQSAEERWPRVVERFEKYVDDVASLGPVEQGRRLPELGCFLPDARADFASGERVKVLEDKDQRRRQRGESRLFDNALMHEYLVEAFSNPIVDARNVLQEVFEEHPDKAREIADGGRAGLERVELATFAGMKQRQKHRQKNGLDRASLEVIGAHFHRTFGTGGETIVVVSASGPFTMKFKLLGQLKNRERAQVATWDSAAQKLQWKQVETPKDATEVEFPLEPDETRGFSVARVALTPGPRSLRNPIDDILVVLYHTTVPEIIVEEGREVSLDDQAWIAEGERKFHKYDPAGSSLVKILEQEAESGERSLRGDDDGDEEVRDGEVKKVYRVRLEGTKLRPRVVDERPPEATDGDLVDGRYAIEPLLELAGSTVRRGHATTEALRRKPHYLDAILEINEGPGRYKIDLEGGDNREIWASRELDHDADPFRYGRALAQLLQHPEALQVEWSNGTWRCTPLTEPPQLVSAFVEARRALIIELKRMAEEKLPRFRRVPKEAAVPLILLKLERVRPQIEALLATWNAAVDATVNQDRGYAAAHDLLLQTDTFRILDSQGAVERLVVLPTNPWMLASLLEFQDLWAKAVQTATEKRTPPQHWKFELTRDEVLQMVPRTSLERWYLWAARDRELEVVDSAPFHLEFHLERARAARSPLDYVANVISTKVTRYLRMHPHLRNARRTLRIGFVNAGTGEQIIAGLEQWLLNTRAEFAGRIRELPMEQIPAIDLFLFATEGDVSETGKELERFFREQVSASEENGIRQALFAKIQYRYCATKLPASGQDSVHICFIHGLVDDKHRQGKTGQLADWWDGGFGDGLLATYLRRSLPSGVTDGLTSRRGLWVDPSAHGLRGALARVLSLQRGCRDGDLALDKALYWESALPDIRSLGPVYDHSDWVVHLDRELSLEIFQKGPRDERPTIIEYSDQEVPDSPGYDTITATKYATPYFEQLGEILTIADLDVAGRSDAAQRGAKTILDDINVLSGSWALDFLLGSIADQRTSTRLKGNVGAALAYRWLRRIELGSSRTLNSNVGPVVPVFISLEDLLRATPAAGLSSKQGLVYRYTNEIEDKENKEASKWCDDLLVLYLTQTPAGAASRLYGRVIEVKFGTGALMSQDKAVLQVRGTQQLLRERLSGRNTGLDAPFRHKQLALLIKTQLEQAVAMGVLDGDIYNFLNVPTLSANLATGNYEVDYTIGVNGQNLAGDAFLLHTAHSQDDVAKGIVLDGVRVITVPRTLVEWLAFEPDDSATLPRHPKTTFPQLGRYLDLQTNPGSSKSQTPPPPEPVPSPTPNEHAIRGAAPPAPVPEAASTPEEPPSASQIGAARPSPRGTAAPIAAPARAASPPDPTPLSVPVVSLAVAARTPIKEAPYGADAVIGVVERLERALVGHKVGLASSPSPRETDRGPRLIRAYVKLVAGESIASIRRISEDLARDVGTSTSDIHITNVPERHAVGVDLPIPSLTYEISFAELAAHASFDAAQRELTLGFCAGIDLTGRPVWADLATMPHMLVAGTTGSGKTVFLRNLILTLLMTRSPRELRLRLSSSKPMDFRVFMGTPHAAGHAMATDAHEARQLADSLVVEMERRYALIDAALCDNLAEYNTENPAKTEPYIVAVFDEYAEMIASFADKQDRDAFESAVGRLAQKARAAGIHLVVCMQRPDANALKGAIKANILHRFALKLPQHTDSRIILDDSGAETLLGQGDLLYKDANSKLQRLQVPFLDNATIKWLLAALGGC